MQQGSYEFDPCTLDGSDKEEETVSLDDWKPTPRKEGFRAPSEWRKRYNDIGADLAPGIDEIKKIRAHIVNKVPDGDIMERFAINAEVLTAIRNNRYDPIEGIILSREELMHKRITKLNNKIDDMHELMTGVVNALINNAEFSEWITKFQEEIDKKKKKKNKKVKAKEEVLQCEDDEDSLT